MEYVIFIFWNFDGQLQLPNEGGGEPEYPEKDPIGSELSVLPKDTPPYVRKNSGAPGLEPGTSWFLVRCSTNWAKEAHISM